MKIALVDSAVNGHNANYLNAIIRAINDEKRIKVVLILPEVSKYKKLNNKNIILYKLKFPVKRNTLKYLIDRLKWFFMVKKMIFKEQVQVVHFLTGDSFYQLSGIFFSDLKKACKKIIVTQHNIPFGYLRMYLFKKFSKKVNKIVVHTEFIKKSLYKKGIKNIMVLDYPALHNTKILEKDRAREHLALPKDKIILLALGETRYNKGLDVLLQSLQEVMYSYCLVIAGEEKYFTKEFIINYNNNIKGDLMIRLKHLTDKEFGWYIDAADCIVLPYRRKFQGASGPMVEAIWRRKPIIGPSHGSIGDLINNYNLGYVFKTENSKDLARVINGYLLNPYNWKETDKAKFYRGHLDTEIFGMKYVKLYTE